MEQISPHIIQGTKLRAWIEPNDSPEYRLDIDVYEDGYVIQATSYIHRPLQWTIEDISPPSGYTE